MYYKRLYIASFQVFIMGSARLSAVYILLLTFIKISVGQQFSLANKQECCPNKSVGLSDGGAQRLLSLLSNPQNVNNNAKPLSGLQQYLLAKQNNQQNLQQCCNVQQKSSNVNVQQSQPNAATDPNSFYTLPLNTQRQILQQIQQLQSGAAPPGYHVGDQSSSHQPLSQGSLPAVNGQVSALPSQVSQGVLLSNLGLASSLPSLIPNACSCAQQNTDQAVVTPQTNVVSGNTVAVKPETTFSTKFIPISAIPMTNNVPSQLQSSPTCVTNQPQNNVDQSVRVEQQGVYQYQPVQQPIPMQGPQTLPAGVDPQALLTSYVLSQLGPSLGYTSVPYQPVPFGYQPAPTSPPPENQGQKSSTLKTLVPLILNLLKEKESCPCPSSNNNNYGSPNEQQNYNDKPQVYQGYANQSNYGQPKRSVESSSQNTTKQDSSDKSVSSPNKRDSSLELEDEEDTGESYEDDIDE